jgi:hypothetical protein
VRPDLAAFRRYVYETVKHHPEIRWWEVWNEPDVSLFWNGSPAELAELCRAAYEEAKRADPTVQVMNAGYTGSAWRWHEEAAKAGALKHADAISFHGYYGATKQPEELYEQFAGIVGHFRELATTYAGRQLPLWDTEGGSGDTTWLRGYESPDLPPEPLRTPMNWREAAYSAVQSAAILQSLGVQRSFQYLWQPSGPGGYEQLGALDMTNAPKPKMIARAAMAELTDGAAYAGTVRRDEGRLWASVWSRPPGSVVMLWAGRGGVVRVEAAWPAPPDQAIDLFGNARPPLDPMAVTEEPCYLSLPAPAEAVLAALRSANLTVVKAPVALAATAPGGEQPPAVPKLPDYAAPAENPAGVFTVDLRPFANMALFDDQPGDGKGGWADEGPLNSLHSMPTGRQTFYGVPFDVIAPAANGGKAIITLRGRNVTPTLPAQVTGIPLGGQRVRNLYFLHAAAWGTPGTIGRYVIHYADGQTVELPLVIGQNTHNWWNGYAEGEAARPVPIRVTETVDGKPAWRYVRVWEWANPRGNVPLVSLDFVSAGGAQTPILVGVTGVR